MTDVGFLYVLANSSMPGLVKVGKTTRSPIERAAELSGVTGLATPFIVVYDQLFVDCHAAESFVHTYLSEKGYRISSNREFFNAPVSLVIKAIGFAPGQIEDDTVTATDLIEDELISSSADHDLDDLQFESVQKEEPWLAIFEEAEAHYYGFGDYIKDETEALRLFRQAASLGSTEAYGRIGRQYQNGEGTQKNITKALEFFKEGARKGRPACYFYMGMMFSEEKNDANADKCFLLFLKNVPNEISIRSDISSDEASDIYRGCIRLLMNRFYLVEDFCRHRVIDKIIVNNKKYILESCEAIKDFFIKRGDLEFSQRYEYISKNIVDL